MSIHLLVWIPKQASAGYIAASNLPVCVRRRSEKMESKGNNNSHVLMFGLSFNFILTLGSLGFTCYSLHRLDSRLTAVEQNLLLTNPAYQLANRAIFTPTSMLPRRSGSRKKENVVKRSADRSSMCRKCSSVCVNSNGQRNVSLCVLLLCLFRIRRSNLIRAS